MTLYLFVRSDVVPSSTLFDVADVDDLSIPPLVTNPVTATGEYVVVAKQPFPTPDKWPFSINPDKLARASQKMAKLQAFLREVQPILSDDNLTRLTKTAIQNNNSNNNNGWLGFEERWKRALNPKDRMKVRNIIHMIKDVVGIIEPDVLGIELSRFFKALANCCEEK